MPRSLNRNKIGVRYGLVKMSDDELVLLRASLDAELRQRNLPFSVGGVGERLVIEHFRKTSELPKLQAAPCGTKNVGCAIPRRRSLFHQDGLLRKENWNHLPRCR